MTGITLRWLTESAPGEFQPFSKKSFQKQDSTDKKGNWKRSSWAQRSPWPYRVSERNQIESLKRKWNISFFSFLRSVVYHLGDFIQQLHKKSVSRTFRCNTALENSLLNHSSSVSAVPLPHSSNSGRVSLHRLPSFRLTSSYWESRGWIGSHAAVMSWISSHI